MRDGTLGWLVLALALFMKIFDGAIIAPACSLQFTALAGDHFIDRR